MEGGPAAGARAALNALSFYARVLVRDACELGRLAPAVEVHQVLPDTVGAHERRGESEHERPGEAPRAGRIARAIAAATSSPAIAAPSRIGPSRKLLALAYYQMDDLANARIAAERAIELGKPPQEGGLQLLLAIRLSNQEYAEAEPALLELLQRYPKKGDRPRRPEAHPGGACVVRARPRARADA